MNNLATARRVADTHPPCYVFRSGAELARYTAKIVVGVIEERYALGELPAEELARIERLLETDPALNRRLQDLRRADEEALERYPAAWMARRSTISPEEHVDGGEEGSAASRSREKPSQLARRKLTKDLRVRELGVAMCVCGSASSMRMGR